MYIPNAKWRAVMQPLLCGKAISGIYCECVCVALVIQHAMHMRHIVICELPVYNIFPLINRKIKKNYFLYKICLKNFHYKKNCVRYEKMSGSLYVNSRYSCPTLLKLQFSRAFRKKDSNIKFHQNPSIGSPVVPIGQTDGQT